MFLRNSRFNMVSAHKQASTTFNFCFACNDTVYHSLVLPLCYQGQNTNLFSQTIWELQWSYSLTFKVYTANKGFSLDLSDAQVLWYCTCSPSCVMQLCRTLYIQYQRLGTGSMILDSDSGQPALNPDWQALVCLQAFVKNCQGGKHPAPTSHW